MDLINKKQTVLNQAGKTLYAPDNKIGHTDEMHENKSETLTQNEWLIKNIPFIETPDNDLDEVYYFRWRNLMSAMSKRRESGKYEFCESAPGAGWYHKYIDCAQGAHVRECRWIKDEKYLNDYLDITPDTTNYREYLTDSVWQKFLLDGDKTCIKTNYAKLKNRLASLEESFDKKAGLYHNFNNIEGEEAGLNGFDRVEKMFVFSASFTAENDSVSALTDNDCKQKMWSCKGSQNKTDCIEISFPFENFTLSSLRIWFAEDNQNGLCTPQNITVTYKNENGWQQVSNLRIDKIDYPQNCTVVNFDWVNTSAVKIEFSNNIANKTYTGIYELVPCFRLEPWGSDDWWNIINGQQSYRVGVNSAEAAAMYALSKMANILGFEEESKEYLKRAEQLRKNIFEKLWSDKQGFFVERIMETNTQSVGKESCAYAPWVFSLVPNCKKYNDAWKFATDKNTFLCEFGLTSLEKNSPHYMQDYNHGCMWNGPVWPYTFSQCLTAISNVLNSFADVPITAKDYYVLLKKYVSCHHDNDSLDKLITREDHHPDENHWLSQAPNYNHSTFVDNILNGLFGICPQEDNELKIMPLTPTNWDYFCLDEVKFCNHIISILYDSDSTKFHKGTGYFVFADGKQIYHSNNVQNIEIDFNSNTVKEIKS